jgi:pimeloyl-ACP methyl ester carboxylesterase
MVPTTDGDSPHATVSTDADRDAPTAFETAQRALFASVGLDPRSQFVDLETPRVRLHVFEAGPPDDDTPLVFVHGTAAFGAFLAPLLAAVEGRRVIAFDRPGYGLSDPFVYTTATVRRTLLDVLDGVLDDLGLDRVDLVGHSMGSHAAILYAGAHPERVRRLFLVGSVPAFPGTRPPWPLRVLTVPGLGRLFQRLQTPGEAGVLDIAEMFGERDAIQRYPELIAAIAAHEADPTAATAGRSEFRALISPLGWRPSVRLTDADLRRVETPTTVVWGDHDTLGTPDAVRGGVETIPDVRFETVAAGHMPYLAHPERCARLLTEGGTTRAHA